MLGLTVPSHLTDHQVDSQLDRCRAGLDFSKLPANRKVAVSKDITALSNEICRLRQTGTSPQCTDSPDSLPASSQDIPGASHKLRLHTSADKTRGRFITTSEDIEVRIENDEGLLSIALLLAGWRGRLPGDSLQLRPPAPFLLQPLPSLPGPHGRPRGLQCLYPDQVLQHTLQVSHLVQHVTFTAVFTQRGGLVQSQVRVRSSGDPSQCGHRTPRLQDRSATTHCSHLEVNSHLQSC